MSGIPNHLVGLPPPPSNKVQHVTTAVSPGIPKRSHASFRYNRGKVKIEFLEENAQESA